ncbi:PD-(D/E)XK nuclease family protein [Mycobacterium sp. E2733]|uniref:PD-(D/E)XK nuclease family protein n=1 Tax=Mycobacterium sp. E2733 TaxID=1834138 RepID=UPI0007FDD7B9|nr:PD-(D/E)XK nuclease family protein [Mycobacterium sp. E2733]OBH94286.1 hypothetical protein A5678_04470 [Mycobacterium sp. E2733]
MAELTPSERRFVTAVEASDAILPPRPLFWSYSSLKEIESCPRQYMLSRASYPDLWSGHGYPPLPIAPAIMGDAVHGVLETVVKALVEAGCETSRAPGAIEVFKSLGGFTALIEQAVTTRLDLVKASPRVDAERCRRLRRELGDRVADARGQVQEYLSRAKFSAKPTDGAVPAEGPAGQEPPAFGRRPVGAGAHAEVILADENLRLMGRVDLLVVDYGHAKIVDYKTGAEDPGHFEQLRLYALLWERDRVVNPTGVPATELTAAYPSHDVTMAAPTAVELRDLEEAVRLRIAAADALFDTDSPPAHPSVDLCGMCHVRSLCDAYWASIAPDPSTVKDGDWFDYEGIVGPPNGVRSLWMLDTASGQRELLLRTQPTSKPLEIGSRVRLLGLRRDADPEVPATTAVMTASSEVFVVTNVGD